MTAESWAVVITATIALTIWAATWWAFSNTERTETP